MKSHRALQPVFQRAASRYQTLGALRGATCFHSVREYLGLSAQGIHTGQLQMRVVTQEVPQLHFCQAQHCSLQTQQPLRFNAAVCHPDHTALFAMRCL